MKRSEMVQNIAIELMTRLPEWEKQERLNFASEILQVVEIEGMLPPPLEKELIRHLTEEVCSEFSVYYNTEDIGWGPEDE